MLAPIGGRIGRSAVTEGALVSSGQSEALAVIQQLDPIYVDVTQPATELLRLRRELAAGQLEKVGDNAARATLTLPDGSAYAHAGRLEFSEVSVDPGTGSVTLRAVFPNPEQQLLPGMFVQAQLQTGSKSAAILAPQQGVTRNPKGEAWPWWSTPRTRWSRACSRPNAPPAASGWSARAWRPATG